MRSRTVREGSVGFLILVGIGLFGGLVLWLQGVQLGNRSYKFAVEFASAQGMQIGTPVRYRGVAVGKITAIKASANGVEVTMEIAPGTLVMPRDVAIEANKSGLIGESSIDITPNSILPESLLTANPISTDCPPEIICKNSRLKGQAGVSLDELIRSTVRLSNLYTDPALFNNIKSIAENTASTAKGAAKLTQDLSSLTQTAKAEIKTLNKSVTGDVGKLSESVKTELATLNQSLKGEANSLTQSLKEEVNSLNQSLKGEASSLNQSLKGEISGVAADVSKVAVTADTSTKAVSAAAINSANSVTQAANKITLTANEVNSLVITNRASLVSTLNNINQSSQELRVAVSSLSPTINRINQGQLLNNLEILSANAAQASATLRDLSSQLNNPATLLLLQQTLDSARATFQNVQKITSDVDELTGDPAFRNNIRRLFNGLGGLLGSTEQLRQQVKVAQTLAPISEKVNASTTAVNQSVKPGLPSFNKQQKLPVIPSQTAKSAEPVAPENTP
ncbi:MULTISPECIES: MlaD family protein [unclassified Microcoleus]|uniref:MlaD family protein n=1 Tax=unclassified Microcoleus TaxID=2642155 RepID=UPI001D590E03|nr:MULTISPECIES: MlaD family protein [unclassified Microcoleus]MCC3420224.1 MCE family protein [Microcoleus sp. PH2017_07_MST_O_A]MCC3502686.1 MCE family protein [Microcoleus sp. PH2017_19_SFW_U_A]MCC3512301.1 MCE family protein [Microcoleus sp. PH2017_17_BER_D_A]TAE13645.1 MAG: MCE family protein [Oscillatoriales cyanobacterium]MCC3471690.1 MCE family protein [Microcoleus sp. PH2017_13_LAR_U_A]